MSTSRHKFKIEERRRQVASLMAQCKSQLEIAKMLNVNQSVISHDIRALKEMSNRFIFDLAKSDLAFYYKNCILGIEEVQKRASEIFEKEALSPKDKLFALKVIKECNESKFSLIEKGPSIMALKSLQERVERIEVNASTIDR